MTARSKVEQAFRVIDALRQQEGITDPFEMRQVLNLAARLTAEMGADAPAGQSQPEPPLN